MRNVLSHHSPPSTETPILAFRISMNMHIRRFRNSKKETTSGASCLALMLDWAHTMLEVYLKDLEVLEARYQHQRLHRHSDQSFGCIDKFLECFMIIRIV